MDFSELTTSLIDLRDTSILEERVLLEKILKSVSDEDLPMLVTILAGEVPGKGKPIPAGTVKGAISTAFGFSIEQVEEKLREKGNLPEVAEALAERRLQSHFSSGRQDVGYVLRELGVLASGTGKSGGQARLSGFLINASPKSARMALEVLLGQSGAFVRKTVLIDGIAQRLGEKPGAIRPLVDEKGWYVSIEELTTWLP